MTRWTSPWADFDRIFATFATPTFAARTHTPTFAARTQWTDGSETPRTTTLTPRITVQDLEKEFVFRAEVPGLNETDIKVSLTNNVLTIHAHRQTQTPEGFTAVRKERPQLSFSHSFELPLAVDGAATTAVVQDGVLTLTLPKHKAALPQDIVVKNGN